MPEQFAGRVIITDSGAEATVRVVVSGDTGTAHFLSERIGDVATTIARNRIAIGAKPRRPTGPVTPPNAGARIAIPDLGEPLPPGEDDMTDPGGEPKSWLSIGDKALPGGLFIIDEAGQRVLRFIGNNATLTVGAKGATGVIKVVDASGELRILLDGHTGDIELTGADCAEEFDLEASAGLVEPGTVMTIGDTGGLRPSCTAYDSRVVGVVSGAGPYRPGLVLDKTRNSVGRVTLALAGKTFCRVDATEVSRSDRRHAHDVRHCRLRDESERSPQVIRRGCG